jgi:hypothetical protein
MADETKKLKDVANGMWNCETSTGEKVVYHSSTVNAVQNKGLIKVIDKVKLYKPKTIKE